MSLIAPLCLPLLWLGAWATWLLAVVADGFGIAFVLIARSRRPRQQDDKPLRRDELSIVIVSWNGLAYLKDLLPTLAADLDQFGGKHEVIVVDNGSDDGTQELLAGEYPWVTPVRLPTNKHFIYGMQAGAEKATNDILVLLNNDMTLEPGFLHELCAPFVDPGLFATTASIAMANPRTETGFTQGRIKRGSLRLEQVEPPDQEQTYPCLWAGGGSSAFDRQKLEELGWFEDLYFPCYVEDLSASWLAWSRGWPIVHTPKSRVHHVQRGTSLRVFGKRGLERLDFRNREIFFWRAITDLRLGFSHALFAPWNAWKDRKRVSITDQCWAIWTALARLPRALALRQLQRATRVLSDREILSRSGSLSQSPNHAASPKS